MLDINILTPATVMQTLKERYKHKRLFLDLTQEGLANKSGVSLGSLKRFESSGQISLESLLKISLVLDCLEDFQQLAIRHEEQFNSIDEIIHKKPSKKRGSVK